MEKIVYRSLHFRVLRNDATYYMQYRKHFWNKWKDVTLLGGARYGLASLAECLWYKDTFS